MVKGAKRKVFALLSILVFIFVFSGCNKNTGSNGGNNGIVKPAPAKAQEPVSKTELLLGTVCKITIYDNPSEEVFKKAFDKIRDIESRMSINIDRSEVMDINAKSGEQFVQVSDETFYVIKNGLHYSNLTNGLFDISIGPIVKLWNINTENAKVPSKEEIDAGKALVNYKDIVLDEAEKRVMLRKKGMILDLGGVAKGYAADAVKKVLKENGVNHAIINLGGNILTVGSKVDGSSWRVGIQNPFSSRGEFIGIVEVSDKSVLTSGIYERYFQQDGKIYHHIINPYTGFPVENDLAGITIIAEDCTDADSLSTGTFILGLEEGYKFIESIDGVEAVFVTHNSEIYLTSGLSNNFIPTDGAFKLMKMK
jgi:FAD:protein FMN transferase